MQRYGSARPRDILTLKRKNAFFEGSDFQHVQAHLHLDNFTEYNVVI